MVMRVLTRFARYLAPGVLVACVVSLGAPSSSAQEVDVPTVADAGGERGAVFAPSAWVVTNVPVQERIGLKLYGFYIGEFKVPVAQCAAQENVDLLYLLHPIQAMDVAHSSRLRPGWC